ncbi:hypothetical protein ACW2QC_03775 [Virgibacillus sp. FSP13]
MNLFLVLFVAMVLALLPTVAIGLVLFVLLSSTSAVNMIFSLHVGNDQLIMFAISLLVYLFSIDSLLELIVKHVVGKNLLYFIALLLIRTLAAYTIGKIIGLDQTISFTIAAGVAFIIFLFECLYYSRGLKKQNINMNR